MNGRLLTRSFIPPSEPWKKLRIISNTVIDAVIANSTPTIIAIITASPTPTARPISVN